MEYYIEAKFNPYRKTHRGGCVIYVVSIILNRSVEDIEKTLGIDRYYSFYEEEISLLKGFLPIIISKGFDKKKIIRALEQGKPCGLLLIDYHAYVLYCSNLKNDSYCLYDPYGIHFQLDYRSLRRKTLYSLIPV